MNAGLCHKPQNRGQAVLELSLFILLLLLWLAAIAGAGQWLNHRLELQRQLALALPHGLASLSTADQRRLQETAAIPAERLEFLDGNLNRSPAGPEGSALGGSLLQLFLAHQTQAIRVTAPSFLPHFLETPRQAVWQDSLSWVGDSLAGSGRLRAALWSAALAQAGVDLVGLGRDLRQLSRRGQGRGGEAIPGLFPEAK